MNTTPTKSKRQPKPVILPEQPSKLIRLALRDLKKCEDQPDKFKVDMSRWVRANSHCSVCLAGAVMVQRFNGLELAEQKKDDYFGISVNELSKENHDQFNALNAFRRGNVFTGCEYLGVSTKLPERVVTSYDINPASFRKDMLALARALEKEGN